jgi:hypothetical protein
MNRFRKPLPVVRRRPGEYVRGIWQPAPEPTPDTVILGIQPATAGDYEQVQANPEGRRLGALLRAYGPLENPLNVAGADNRNGDLVLHDGRYWLVIGKHVREHLSARVRHTRYLLAQEIEHSDGEVVS